MSKQTSQTSLSSLNTERERLKADIREKEAELKREREARRTKAQKVASAGVKVGGAVKRKVKKG